MSNIKETVTHVRSENPTTTRESVSEVRSEGSRGGRSPADNSGGQFPPVVVVDFGRHNSRRVKSLRQGDGRLMSDMQLTLKSLVDSGELQPGAQIVVAVVERRTRARGLFSDMFLNDDDDDD